MKVLKSLFSDTVDVNQLSCGFSFMLSMGGARKVRYGPAAKYPKKADNNKNGAAGIPCGRPCGNTRDAKMIGIVAKKLKNV